MKRSLALILSCLVLLTYSTKIFAYSNAGSCKIYDGTVFVTWYTIDENGAAHIWASTGPVSDPSSWTAQEISIGGVGSPNVSIPNLHLNINSGNVFADWEYWDNDLSIMRNAVATYPFGASSWSTQVISDVTTEASGFFDNQGDVDEDGNFIVTWSALDNETSNLVVRCATAVTDGSTAVWSPSFIVPGADPLASKKAAQQLKKTLPTKK
ncbi:MAG: hypothetical protein JSR46_11470 [Verrucomicrobia bacterium]|nr:hypothetical protein [Verrucomicrobiota bacterium]